ncbi:MAG: RdgB/HAM1 family non-canonical purine NTP pyrophosphatase, partial [Candidatus Didemnitutus sp.]|nr:RdgB/HAM1 family non-canonical purine NTP pyrophosphatase [Candidatus Didemnitutus sp.]
MILHLASGNAHKAQELQRLADVSPGWSQRQLKVQATRHMPEVAEDTGTFIGNARKKAMALQPVLPADSWILADDSGVCVDALAGAPGVESAYFAGPKCDPAANLAKLVAVLREVPDGQRRAHFRCVLLLLGPRGREQVFEGRCEGVLRREPQGREGFGYDPIFQPDGFDRTYAELTAEEKNRISHRGRAWVALADWLAR